MLGLKKHFLPPSQHLLEVSVATVSALAGTILIPKYSDNAALAASYAYETYIGERPEWLEKTMVSLEEGTQWLEDHASIVQIFATPQQETREQIIESTAGNIALGIPITLGSMYSVAFLMWLADQRLPWEKREPEVSDNENVDKPDITGP